MSKRVGNLSTKKPEEKKEREKKVKAVYPITKCVDMDGKSIVNEEGKLIAIPQEIKDGDKIIQPAWSAKNYKPIGKAKFAATDVFLDFRAALMLEKAARMTVIGEKMAKRAERLRKYGDEGTRKKALKLAKYREQIATLEAELAAEGITVEDDD